LTELLIALTLFSLVLATFFSLFRHTMLATQKMKEAYYASQLARRAELRLQELFMKVACDPKARSYFYNATRREGIKASQILVFSFYRKVAEPAIFSGNCLAKLYVEKGTLFLAMWPNPLNASHDSISMQKEKLFEHVSDVEIQFWAPPTVQNKPEKEQIPRGQWLDKWLIEYEKMPALVRLTMNQKLPGKEKKKLSFSFVIANDLEGVQL